MTFAVHDISSPEENDEELDHDAIVEEPDANIGNPENLAPVFTTMDHRTEKQHEIWFLIDEIQSRQQEIITNEEGCAKYGISTTEFDIEKKLDEEYIASKYHYPIGSRQNINKLQYLQHWKNFLSSYTKKKISMIIIRGAQSIGMVGVQKREDLFNCLANDFSYAMLQRVWHVLYGQFDLEENIFEDLEIELMSEYDIVYTQESMVSRAKKEMENSKRRSIGPCCIEKAFKWKRNAIISIFNEKLCRHYGITIAKSRQKEDVSKKRFLHKREGEKGMFKPDYIKFHPSKMCKLPTMVQEQVHKISAKHVKHKAMLNEEQKNKKHNYLKKAENQIRIRVRT